MIFSGRYPDLSNEKIISFDIETYDPGLDEGYDPGVYREDGYVLGVGIHAGSGFSEYYNFNHKDITSDLKLKNINYIKEIMGLPCNKLGAFLLYDYDWLENGMDIKIKGKCFDVLIAEPLIDENRRLLGIKEPYSLDALSKKYLNKSKKYSEVQNFCDNNNLKGNPRKWLWKMPHELVREYVIQDVELPLEIFKKQWSILNEEDLLYVFDLEMRLLPLLMKMRKIGVRIDMEAVSEGIHTLRNKISVTTELLNKTYGEFNINSTKQIAKKFDALDIPYPLREPTKKMREKGIFVGNPNIDKFVLESLSNNYDIAKFILDIRGAYKTLNTFLINGFCDHSVRGRIHCQLYPVGTDTNGTKSGRLSSANPNLQNIPSVDELLRSICRKCFIPEIDCWWGRRDYTQIEYRYIAHYAEGEKSDEIRRKYNEDHDTDYHALVMEWTGLERKPAKRMNFGAAYFMGITTCAKKFGWTIEATKQLFELYHTTLPFVKYTRNKVVRTGKRRGYIRTILGRRARVTQYMRDNGKEHSLFNRLIQGSAADHMKKSMVDAYEAGLFDVLYPHLTVHDELDVSIPKSKSGLEAFDELGEVMNNAIKLKVPVSTDAEIGDNWGELKKYNRNKAANSVCR